MVYPPMKPPVPRASLPFCGRITVCFPAHRLRGPRPRSRWPGPRSGSAPEDPGSTPGLPRGVAHRADGIRVGLLHGLGSRLQQRCGGGQPVPDLPQQSGVDDAVVGSGCHRRSGTPGWAASPSRQRSPLQRSAPRPQRSWLWSPARESGSGPATPGRRSPRRAPAQTPDHRKVIGQRGHVDGRCMSLRHGDVGLQFASGTDRIE